MKIEQANKIAIAQILEKINILPETETETTAVYRSPIRISYTADFYVDKVNNTWADQETGLYGNLVELVREYLKYHKESCTEQDALRYIEIMSGNAPRIRSVLPNATVTEDSLTVDNVEPLDHQGLFNHLGTLKIDLHIAMKYLKEVTVLNTKTNKVIVCLGSENDNYGYDLHMPGFEGQAGEKYIRFIRGSSPEPKDIHIFKDIYMFLSLLTILKMEQLKDDVLILNGYGNLDKATPYIAGYGYHLITTWFDDDKIGKLATEAVADFVPSQEGLSHRIAKDMIADSQIANDQDKKPHLSSVKD